MDTPVLRLQDLPPRWARFCLQVASFAADELACPFTRKNCLVACSGGSDSTALLVMAAILCRRDGGTVFAAHLDHALRPESVEDAAFVDRICNQLDVPLISRTRDVGALAKELGVGVEEAGRRARYELYEDARREFGAELVLVGHQLDDLAEDQLMRLVRGAGWPSLGGMCAYDPSRSVLRPLLLTPKAALEEFLKDSGMDWRVDASNFDHATTRNRVRNGIMPALCVENPAYLDAAARLWRQARMDEAHWDTAVAQAHASVSKDGEARLIPARLLQASPGPLRLRIIKAVLEEMGPGQPLCDGLLKVDALWRKGKTGKSVRFPGDKEARIAKPGIRVQVIDRKKASG
jgi:tRNA(Ile)-lysidine synthase